MLGFHAIYFTIQLRTNFSFLISCVILALTTWEYCFQVRKYGRLQLSDASDDSPNILVFQVNNTGSKDLTNIFSHCFYPLVLLSHLLSPLVSHSYADFCEDSFQGRYCIHIWNWFGKFKTRRTCQQPYRYLFHLILTSEKDRSTGVLLSTQHTILAQES